MRNIIFILLLTLLFSNVFFVDVNNSLIGDGYDNYEFFGFMNLVNNNILSFKHPFSHTNILRYPEGFDFSYGFDGVFAILTGGILSLWLDPILSYNLTIVTILFLNIFFSFYYFRKLGILRGAESNLDIKSLISAIIFGLSPYVFARVQGHLNLALVAGIPMFTYYYLYLNNKIVQEQEVTTKDLLAFLSSVLLISFGSLQYLILLAAMTPFVLLLTFKKEDISKYKKALTYRPQRIINSLFIFLLIFVMFFYGYVSAIFSGELIYQDKHKILFEPHIIDVLVPNEYLGDLWGLVNPSELAIERVITVGTLEAGILVYLLIKLKDKKAQLVGIGLFLSYLLLSFKILNIPYYPEGGRTVILISLFIAVAIVSYDHIFSEPIYAGLVLTLIMLERLFFHVQVSEPLAADLFIREVRPISGGAVLNVPLSKYSTYRSALPVFYDKKVLDGYFHYTAATKVSEKTLHEKHFSRMVCRFERDDEPETGFSPGDRPEALQAFKEKDIGAIVLFKDSEVGKFLYEDCDNVRDWWYYLRPETLVLSHDTPGVVKNNFAVPNHNPHTIARFYFERSGELTLNGLLVTPGGYDDLKVRLPSGEVIIPNWQNQPDGLSAQFDPPLQITVRAGEYLTLSSDQQAQENRYINAYYLFKVDRTSLSSRPIPIELLYSDSKVEIYQLNQ